MIYTNMSLKESRTMVTATFEDCGCIFGFDKWHMANNKMTIQINYCSKYPRCGKQCTSVFDQARAKLLAEASEATLVIPDEDADTMIGMDWTGQI